MSLFLEPKNIRSSGPQRCTQCGIFLVAAAYPSPDERGTPTFFLSRGTVGTSSKGNVMGTPTNEPQEYSRNIMEYKDPVRYIPIIFLRYSWGSLFVVPIQVPLSSFQGVPVAPDTPTCL